MGEYKWQGGVGSKGDNEFERMEGYPHPPVLHEVVPKSLKIQGISVIHVRAHACNRLK